MWQAKMLYGRAANRRRDFINRSTVVQTVNQMVVLAEMVGECGFVPKEEILSPAEYKRTCLGALMHTVRQRVDKLRRSGLDPADFTIKGAVEFLRLLRSRGVTVIPSQRRRSRGCGQRGERLGICRTV